MKDQRRFPPERLLVATDLGESSAAAMSAAAYLHRKYAARVHVLHAHRRSPDLVIMGAERRVTAMGEIFSSTTERVMRHTAVPILVVPRW